MTTLNISQLETTAKAIRSDIITMLHSAGSGHPGGSLSAADLMTYLYFHKMNVNAEDPKAPLRDRFVLSKGHAAPVLYAVLAHKGFFPREKLQYLRQTGAMLQGHPDAKKTPGVDISTGSLGQGFSNAVGMALGLNGQSSKVYALLGDGELQEGIVWEAAMCAAHYGLDHLRAIIDDNGLQIDGPVADVMNVGCIEQKWRAFGWHVIRCDGHDFQAIHTAFEEADTVQGRPVAIVAKTVKGKGVPFMENEVGWHGATPNEDQKNEALAALK
ncbi:MAG: transketolase [Bacilli bacterium]